MTLPFISKNEYPLSMARKQELIDLSNDDLKNSISIEYKKFETAKKFIYYEGLPRNKERFSKYKILDNSYTYDLSINITRMQKLKDLLFYICTNQKLIEIISNNELLSEYEFYCKNESDYLSLKNKEMDDYIEFLENGFIKNSNNYLKISKK